MTEQEIISRIRTELNKNGGDARAACEKVASWVDEHHMRLKAFWSRFGVDALMALERDHQRKVRQGWSEAQIEERQNNGWTPPENHGRNGRAEAIARRGSLNRYIALFGKRVRLSEVECTTLKEHGEIVVQHAKEELRTGKMYVAIGEKGGGRTVGEAWDDLSADEQTFLLRRTEPAMQVA